MGMEHGMAHMAMGMAMGLWAMTHEPHGAHGPAMWRHAWAMALSEWALGVGSRRRAFCFSRPENKNW